MDQQDNHRLFEGQRQYRRTNTFGPSVGKAQLEAKQIEDDFKKQQTVSFKMDDQIIIVENWKQYNTDVSNPNSNKNSRHKSQGCLNVCNTF